MSSRSIVVSKVKNGRGALIRSLYRSLRRASKRYDQYPWFRTLLATEPTLRPYVDGLKFFVRNDSCGALIRKVFDDKSRLSPHASTKAVDVAFTVLRAVGRNFTPVIFPMS